MFEKVANIIAEYADIPAESITPDTNIRTDLGLNSLELVNMAVAIEDEFDVEIPDREALGLETISDIVSVLDRYVNV